MTNVRTIVIPLFSFFIFLFFFDLYALGGGRVVEISGITLRMVLFPVAIFLSAISILLYGGLNYNVLGIFFTFLILLCCSSLISSMEGFEFLGSAISYSFFALVLFFDRYPKRLYRAACNLIPVVSILMSLGYLFFLLAVFIGRISFLDVYNYIPESELFLRGTDGFVFKGFLYILIGSLYFFIVPRFGKVTRVLAFLLCVIAIFATLTRGFVVSLFFVLVVYLFWNSRTATSKLLIVLLLLSTPVVILTFFPDLIFREGSDDVRMNDFVVFLDFLDSGLVSVVFGSGLGTYFGNRPMIENFVMDVWFRFGLVGLIALMLVFLKITVDFHTIYKHIQVKECAWLYFSVLLIYVQSLFNPYVNNYIGGTFVVFSLVYFNWRRKQMFNVDVIARKI